MTYTLAKWPTEMSIKTLEPNIHDQVGFAKIMLDDVIILEDINASPIPYPTATTEAENMKFWLDGVSSVYILTVYISDWDGTNEWDGAGSNAVNLYV